jgi:hypothetical protein
MWRRTKDWDPSHLVSRQQASNQQMWARLQTRGVTDETPLRLDFTYRAPGEQEAEDLGQFLRAATGYDVKTHGKSVEGTTRESTINLSVLDEWVSWMVLAGYHKGRCEFDGWGAEVS